MKRINTKKIKKYADDVAAVSPYIVTFGIATLGIYLVSKILSGKRSG